MCAMTETDGVAPPAPVVAASIRTICWICAIFCAAYAVWSGLRLSLLCEQSYALFRDLGIMLPGLTEIVLSVPADLMLVAGAAIALLVLAKEGIMALPAVRLGSTVAAALIISLWCSIVETALLLPLLKTAP